MPTFTYKARTVGGKLVDGVLTADNETAALRALDERSLFPVDVNEGGRASRSLLSGGRKKIRTQRLAEMYGQLADLLRAGVPVLRALDVLCRQNSSLALTEILREVKQDVGGGETLADAMAKHPNAFSELHVSMIRAGEEGAFLEDVLQRIATFAERQNELRSKMIGSMVYPCVLVTVGTVVLIVLLVYVVPQVREFLPEENLPILTTAVFALCDTVRDYLWLIGLAIGVVLVAAVSYFRSVSGREKLDRIKLWVPGVGRIYRMVAICRFCRILGTLLANGVPILQALRISKESAGNRILEDIIGEATENVRKGEPLAEPLRAGGIFPPDILDMIAVGEESNNLDNVLIQIADSNEARTARLIDLAVRLIEPVLLVVMAAVVLLIALALLIPILTGALAGMGGP
ncbi:MAG TPA: type II secretion system F family protein [Phycisphaerae bacterium]|nr:type II secretion system F family protein [Phycisphaerae bacterium]